jgi:hypothetical protein
MGKRILRPEADRLHNLKRNPVRQEIAMQILSLVWGILAILGMLVGFTPCLGALNWLNIPFAAIGLIISIVAWANAPPGKKGGALGGMVCCAVAVVMGLLRLVIGGGIL